MISEIGNWLTLAVYEMVVEPAIFAVRRGYKWERLSKCRKGRRGGQQTVSLVVLRKGGKCESEDRELVDFMNERKRSDKDGGS